MLKGPGLKSLVLRISVERLFSGGFMILDENTWLGFKFLIFLVLNLLIFNITRKCPEQDLNMGPSRIAVFEDCKATALTTQRPWLLYITYIASIHFPDMHGI